MIVKKLFLLQYNQRFVNLCLKSCFKEFINGLTKSLIHYNCLKSLVYTRLFLFYQCKSCECEKDVSSSRKLPLIVIYNIDKIQMQKLHVLQILFNYNYLFVIAIKQILKKQFLLCLRFIQQSRIAAINTPNSRPAKYI